MKACLLRSPAPVERNPLEFADAPDPKPSAGELLVRVTMCGICRTDLHVVEGELSPKKSPVIPGHQIVGIVEVAREAYPDPTAEKGDWVSVDMKAVGPMPKPVTLAAIKADPKFADLELVRQSRLSVVPVSKPHWDRICQMGGWKR